MIIKDLDNSDIFDDLERALERQRKHKDTMSSSVELLNSSRLRALGSGSRPLASSRAMASSRGLGHTAA